MKVCSSLYWSLSHAFLLMTFAVTCVATQSATLLSQWPFDNNFNSSNDPDYNLAPGGNVALVPSPWGSAVEFHGGTFPISDLASLSNPSLDRLDTVTSFDSLAFASGFSIIVWIKPTASSFGPIASHESSSFNGNQTGFGFNSYNSTIDLSLHSVNGNLIGQTTGNEVHAGEWNQVAATWDGSTANGFAMYVNGVAVAFSVFGNNFTGLSGGPDLPLRIGAHLGNSENNVIAADGEIDSFATFIGVLTPEEIASNYVEHVPEGSPMLCGVMAIGGLLLAKSRLSSDGARQTCG